MTATVDRTGEGLLHPVHSVLPAGSVPLSPGAVPSDRAYRTRHEVQSTNFASWLVAGALPFTGFAPCAAAPAASGRRPPSGLAEFDG